MVQDTVKKRIFSKIRPLDPKITHKLKKIKKNCTRSIDRTTKSLDHDFIDKTLQYKRGANFGTFI